MAERQRILDLIDRAYRANAWQGPSLLEALDGVSSVMAAKRLKRGMHSIWELVEHVASWNEIVAKRIAGEPPRVTPEMNFPPVVKTTPTAWKATKRRLARTHARFRREVARFPMKKIGRRRPRIDHTWNVLIYGQLQHVVYHTGQIAMLRRGLGKPVKSS